MQLQFPSDAFHSARDSLFVSGRASSATANELENVYQRQNMEAVWQAAVSDIGEG